METLISCRLVATAFRTTASSGSNKFGHLIAGRRSNLLAEQTVKKCHCLRAVEFLNTETSQEGEALQPVKW